jgi:sensor domain CHASE-containing protein
MITDNAKWDDAVTKVYGEADQQWLNDTWGLSSADQNYDSVLIIDETGKTVAMFVDGEATTTQPTTFFGPGLEKLLNALPRDNVTFATSVGIPMA